MTKPYKLRLVFFPQGHTWCYVIRHCWGGKTSHWILSMELLLRFDISVPQCKQISLVCGRCTEGGWRFCA